MTDQPGDQDDMDECDKCADGVYLEDLCDHNVCTSCICDECEEEEV